MKDMSMKNTEDTVMESFLQNPTLRKEGERDASKRQGQTNVLTQGDCEPFGVLKECVIDGGANKEYG